MHKAIRKVPNQFKQIRFTFNININNLHIFPSNLLEHN